MKFYTSCFSNLELVRKKGLVPVSIALWSPKGWRGWRLTKLAPSKEILMEYKRGGGEKRYIERFKKEVLGKLDCKEGIERMVSFLKERGVKGEICFMCYEREGEFCHRRLVGEWLKENGYEVEEV